MLNLLFIGNSYTFYNDLDRVTAEVFEAAAPSESVQALRLAEGGYTFPMHLAQADGTNGDTPWSQALVTGTTDWDWVILQDQSQIPGFPEGNPDRDASVTALASLDAMVDSKHGQSVLLMTWGRLHGDASNPDLYPDYLTMQGLLASGYEGYAASITTAERTAWIAPAGYAWRHIYEQELSEGVDPTEPGHLFSSLYVDDGSHPTALGTYLVACVVYATITGEDPTRLPAPAAVPAETAAVLQAAAAAAVFEESPEIAYPWQQGGDSGDSGTGDSGDSGGTDTAGDSGTRDSGDSSDSGRPNYVTNEPKACGCASGGSGLGGFAGGALAAVLSLWSRSRRGKTAPSDDRTV